MNAHQRNVLECLVRMRESDRTSVRAINSALRLDAALRERYTLRNVKQTTLTNLATDGLLEFAAASPGYWRVTDAGISALNGGAF